MAVRAELSAEARALPKEERARILSEIPETELHFYLADLFRVLDSNYWVEVTHGSTELGKDVVIVRNDPLAADVMAVVVKRGDIKAKTSGVVDEVKRQADGVLTAKGENITRELLSQIAQSQLHPAELKARFVKLQVTKVLVVLVGEISNHARVRLEKELQSSGKIFDLLWLVDAFTEHYPQVFFDGKVVDFLDDLVRQLERDTFYVKSGKTLSECFVEPVVAQLDEGVTLDEISYAVHVKRTRVKFAQLHALLRGHPRVLLVGDPGSGKSKVAAKLCIDRYREVLSGVTRTSSKDVSQGIPLMLPARRLLEFASAAALVETMLPSAASERLFVDLLIVDGLDEVPVAEREPLLALAEEFAGELKTSLLVTTRKVAALKASPRGFERYELLPLEFGQAIKLVEKISVSRDVLTAVKDGLQKIQAQVPMSPLSLLLLVDVVAERKEVPASITELYDRYLDLVFGRWDQEKGIEVIFEYLIKKRFLGALSYELFRSKNRLEVPQEEFNDFVRDYAVEYGWDEERLRAFLKEIERAGVLSIQEEVYFRHRSFLDYFVALHLFEQRSQRPGTQAEIVETYYDSLWSEVSFFFAGLGREVTPALLDAIRTFERPGQNLAFEKLMSARLLQAGWHSTAKVKEDGVRAALSHLPAVNRMIAGIFEKAGIAMGPVLSSATAVLAVDTAVGSVVLSGQLSGELDNPVFLKDRTEDAFLRRVALLWVARRFMSPQEHGGRIKAYLADIQAAQLSAGVEAKYLLLGAIADGAHKNVLKAIGSRLKRLAQKSPAALKALLPSKKTVGKKRVIPVPQKRR